MESRSAMGSRSFLFIIITIIVIITGYGIYYILSVLEEPGITVNQNKTSIMLVTNNTANLKQESGRISGILEGPVVVNITGQP